MFKKNWVVWASAIAGAAPDLIGFAEKLFYWGFSRWNWYLWAHKEAWYLWIIPPYGFHCFIDWLTHDDSGWNSFAWAIEISGWLMLIMIAWGFYLRKRR
jgi:hypothetical protein